MKDNIVQIIQIGKFKLSLSKGQSQLVSFQAGSSGQYGSGGYGGKAGIPSSGGCGEIAYSCDVSGNFRKCESYSDCHGQYKGKDCLPNSKGRNGQNGQRLSNNASPEISVIVHKHFLMNAGAFHLDMLLNYAMSLANQETVDESQEILVYLTKFQGHTGLLAQKMLDQMGNEGQLKSTLTPINVLPFKLLNSRLSKTIARGQKVEDLLNTMGMFERQALVFSIKNF